MQVVRLQDIKLIFKVYLGVFGPKFFSEFPFLVYEREMNSACIAQIQMTIAMKKFLIF